MGRIKKPEKISTKDIILGICVFIFSLAMMGQLAIIMFETQPK